MPVEECRRRRLTLPDASAMPDRRMAIHPLTRKIATARRMTYSTLTLREGRSWPFA